MFFPLFAYHNHTDLIHIIPPVGCACHLDMNSFTIHFTRLLQHAQTFRTEQYQQHVTCRFFITDVQKSSRSILHCYAQKTPTIPPSLLKVMPLIKWGKCEQCIPSHLITSSQTSYLTSAVCEKCSTHFSMSLSCCMLAALIYTI